MSEIRQQLEQKLKNAREHQERVIKELAESQASVSRLETALSGLTPEREHFVTQLVATGVVDFERYPF